MIAYVLLAAFAVAYLVWVFLFDRETGGIGPFISQKRIYAEHVMEDGYEQDTDLSAPIPRLYIYHVTLWDRIRQWINRPYRVEPTPYMAWEPADGIDEIWFKNDHRMQVWECPKCLTFWMAIPTSLLYMSKNGLTAEILLVHVSTVGLSLLIQSIYDWFSAEVEIPPTVMISMTSLSEDDEQ